MPNGKPNPYWPGTTTLVTEIDAPSYDGQLPAKRLHGRGTGVENSNVTTRNARHYLDECFRLCGGIESFVKWAKAEPSAFYPLYIKARCPKPIEDAGEDQQITIIVSGRTELPVSKQLTQAVEQAEEKQG